MRVIDGMHRLRAAKLKGDRVIAVKFFDGSEEAAFVKSVAANVTHGMPLSLEDRRAAAIRIIKSMPHLSDRAIAKYTGLADKTVGAIRRRSTTNSDRTRARVGMDGRYRPINGDEGRRIAAETIAANPTAPLREVAKIAGVSLGTAHTVRKSLLQGANPIASKARGRDGSIERSSASDGNRVNYQSRLRNLQKDPSLRFSDMGKELLRSLKFQHSVEERLPRVAEAVPPHLIMIISDMALHCAEVWRRFANELRAREGEVGDL